MSAHRQVSRHAHGLQSRATKNIHAERLAPWRWLAFGIVAVLALGCASHKPSITPRPPSPFIAGPQRIVFDGDEVHIPFELDCGVPVLTSKPEVGQPQRFALDTGSATTVFTPGTAAACRCTTRSSPAGFSFHDVAEWYTPEGVAHLADIQIGPVRFENFDATIEQMTCNYDGLLGWPLFMGTLLTIDYPNRQLVLKHGGLPEPDGRRILPIRINDGYVQVKATLCGEDVWLGIDTGCGGYSEVMVDPSLAARLAPWWYPKFTLTAQGVVHQATVKYGRLNGDLVFGCYHLKQVLAGTNEGLASNFLGANALSHFTVTLDLQHLRVEFENPSDTEFTADPLLLIYGFECDYQHGPLTVSAIWTGSEAERSGLHSGDILLSVDGHPARQGLESHDFPQPLALEIERGVSRMRLTVPFTTLIR